MLVIVYMWINFVDPVIMFFCLRINFGAVPFTIKPNIQTIKQTVAKNHLTALPFSY